MPALSQNLIFNITNGNTSTQSVQVVYPNTGTTALVYASNKLRGDGYSGGSAGIQTVFWNVTGFVGIIDIQGTLATDPQENDWASVPLSTVETGYFNLDTTGLVRPGGTVVNSYTSPTDAITYYNYTGNFVWIRAYVSRFTQGVVNSISING
jgi:hypothetical protein